MFVCAVCRLEGFHTESTSEAEMQAHVVNHIRSQRVHDSLELERAARVQTAQAAGGARGFRRNRAAQDAVKRNGAAVARAARNGLTKREAARELGIDVKTVRKHWPSGR